jgi:hypothetical protein
MEVKLTLEEAEAIVQDPVSARYFLAYFPTDATFVELDTAEKFRGQRAIKKRIDFAMENYNTIWQTLAAQHWRLNHYASTISPLNLIEPWRITDIFADSLPPKRYAPLQSYQLYSTYSWLP